MLLLYNHIFAAHFEKHENKWSLAPFLWMSAGSRFYLLPYQTSRGVCNCVDRPSAVSLSICRGSIAVITRGSEDAVPAARAVKVFKACKYNHRNFVCWGWHSTFHFSLQVVDSFQRSKTGCLCCSLEDLALCVKADKPHEGSLRGPEFQEKKKHT